MLVNATINELHWSDSPHSVHFSGRASFINSYHAEVYHYKNEDVTVLVSFKILEHENLEKNFEVVYDAYTHITPVKIKLELHNHVIIGSFETLDEAKDAAQNYFNHHHYLKGHH